MKQQENNKTALENKATDLVPEMMDGKVYMEQQRPATEDDLFQQAICCYRQTDYDLAITHYTKIIGLTPNYTCEDSAYHNRGLCYYKKGNYALAIVDFSKAIELNLGRVEPYFYRGVCYYEQGSYEHALVDFSKAIEILPNFDDAYHERSLCYLKQGNYDSALADCNKVIELAPDKAESYFARGFCFYEQKNYEPAIADFSKAIELAPDVSDAYQYRGRCYDKQQNYKLAFVDYAKVIEFNIDDSSGYNNRIINLDMGKVALLGWDGLPGESRQKEVDPVLVNFNKTIELEPDNANAYYDRGDYYYKKHNYQLALIDCTKAIELKPDLLKAYYFRAWCYRTQQNYMLALVDFSKVIELKPDSSGSYYGRGICYEEQDNNELALDNYTKAIELKPEHHSYYYARAYCYKKQKKYKLALADLSKVIELEPEIWTLYECYRERAEYYRRQENYELALADYTKTIELAGNYYDYKNRGLLYFYLENYKLALIDFTQVIELVPDYVEFDTHYIFYKRAVCYYEQEQYDLGLLEIDNAIKLCKSLKDKKEYCFTAKSVACSAKQYDKARSYIEQVFEDVGSKEQKHKDIYLQEIDKTEELEEKNKQLVQEIKEKEAAHKALHEKEKEMLSFFTHTMRNALSTAPESLRQAIRLLGSEDYETDKKHYKAINKIAALFSTLSLTDCLIDTFKQSISEPEEFQRAWSNDSSGDATPKWVIASALRQSLNRIIFMSDTSELRQLLNNADTPAIIATRKSFIENILPLNLDNQGIESFYKWLKQINTLEISIDEKISLHFGVNQVRFSLLFAITSELLLNALKYWDGTGKIQVSWQLEKEHFMFRVTNPCLANASSNLAGTHKGLAFIKRLIELLGEQASFTPIAEENSFTAEVKLHQSLLENQA